jgi:hypothetical protein
VILVDMLIPLHMTIHLDMPIWNVTWRRTDLAIEVLSPSRTNLIHLDMLIWSATDLAIKVLSSSRTNLISRHRCLPI